MNSAQRKSRNVIINDTNINTNIIMKYLSVVNNTSLWHKIYVSNCAKLDKKLVLKTIMDNVYPNDFIPVNYTIEDTKASFLIKNCGGFIIQICQQNLIISNPTSYEHPFKFSISLGFANTHEIRVNMVEKISPVIKKRFSPESKVLNLESFYNDPDLEEFCPLSQPKILLFILDMCKGYPFLTLKLGNNEIRTLDALTVLVSLKVGFGVDLKNNLIENEDELKILKPLLITDLTLEGNPICENKIDIEYIKMIKNNCPNVKKIDGIAIWNNFQTFRRNFLCNINGKELIDQFLEHYFTLYDTPNRNLLESVYHPEALFSLTSHYISGQLSSSNIRLMSYKKYSRNIKFMSNMLKCDEFVFKGQKKIVEILADLPLSEHDPYSFTVDLIHYSENLAIFVVTGVFREPAESLSDAERYLGFSRTFVLHKIANDRFVIVNEEMHVNNATTSQQNTSFKNVRVPGNLALPPAKTEKEKNDLVMAMKGITTLNISWSRRCLEDSNYDFKQALTKFIGLFKSDRLPAVAFKEEEIPVRLDACDNWDDTVPPAPVIKQEPMDEDDKANIEIPVILPTQKGEYYVFQNKRIVDAKQAGNIDKAIEIAKDMANKYPQDAAGYRELLLIYFENKDFTNGRNVLQQAQEKIPKKKFTNMLKTYYSLELSHGDPLHLLQVIERDKHRLKVIDYFLEYVQALIKCNDVEKARNFVKINLKSIQYEPRHLAQLKELEKSTKYKLL